MRQRLDLAAQLSREHALAPDQIGHEVFTKALSLGAPARPHDLRPRNMGKYGSHALLRVAYGQ